MSKGNAYLEYAQFLKDQNRITDLKKGDVLIARGRYTKKGKEIIFGSYADINFDYFYNESGDCVYITSDFDKKI